MESSQSAENLEVLAFTEVRPKLKSGLNSGVKDIASQAFSIHLIPSCVMDRVINRDSNETSSERTETLLGAIAGKIDVNGENYYKFLELIKEEPAYADIAKIMEEEIIALYRKKFPVQELKHSDDDEYLSNCIFLLQDKNKIKRLVQNSPPKKERFISQLKMTTDLEREDFELLFNSAMVADPSKLRMLVNRLGKKDSSVFNQILVLVSIVTIISMLLMVGIATLNLAFKLSIDTVTLESDLKNVPMGRVDKYKQETVYHNLPKKSASSPFFGRETNISVLTNSLLKGNQLIHIHGPPAFGKSSLAIQVGWEIVTKHSSVFKEVRYIDTTTTKLSIFLCASTSESNLRDSSSGQGSSIQIPDNSQSSNHYSSNRIDSEPDVCEWSKSRTHRSILILDNCDPILRESKDDFLSLVHQINDCYDGTLSLIITSQEKILLLHDCFQSIEIAELDPQDSIRLLHHHVPNINYSVAQNLSSIVGHCPLALKVIGRLLALKGSERIEILVNDLKHKVVSTISNKLTDHKDRFQTIMDFAYKNLTIDIQECCIAVSFFPSSFNAVVGRNILSGIVSDPDCVQGVLQKSFVEEFYIASKKWYNMNKLVRSYFQEMHGNTQFYLNKLEIFNENFLSHYSSYLINAMKNRYKFRNISDEDLHTFFYLEYENIKAYHMVSLLRFQSEKTIVENEALALAMLIIENIGNYSENFTYTLDLETAYIYYTENQSLYSKLCYLTSTKVCSQFAWKLLLYKTEPYCINKFHNSIMWMSYYMEIFICLSDNKHECHDILSCKNLAFFTQSTTSIIDQKVKESGTIEETLLFSLLQNILIICRRKWIIWLALKLSRLTIEYVVSFTSAIIWFKYIVCFNFKETAAVLRWHTCAQIFLQCLDSTSTSNIQDHREMWVNERIYTSLVCLFALSFISSLIFRNYVNCKSIFTARYSTHILYLAATAAGIYFMELGIFLCHLLIILLMELISILPKFTSKLKNDSKNFQPHEVDKTLNIVFDGCVLGCVFLIIILILVFAIAPFYLIKFGLYLADTPETITKIMNI